MSRFKFLLSTLSGLVLLLFTSIGCNENTVDPVEEELTENQALEKMADEDDVIQSFEPNYNEEEAMEFLGLGKINTAIFPVRVGQRMHLVSKNLNITFDGDSAYGELTKTFEGILFIAASYDEFEPGDSNVVDTLIQKPFTTVVTRNIIFEKVRNTIYPMLNWRIAAVSLPEGGTLTENIQINKMTVYLPNGDSIVVNEPNDYYLSRGPGFWRQVPILNRHESVKIRIEIQSAYADTDFVTLTYGACRRGHFKRAKRRFELVSEYFDGQYYQRVFENTWTTHQHVGFKHAIINALPRQVIFDDSAPVETNSWGMPYIIK